MNELSAFDKLIDIYEKQLNIPHNNNCQICGSLYKQPLLPWVIGRNYFTENGRIFIGGKPHRGTPKYAIKRVSGVIDGRGRGKDIFDKENWPYWSYTKAMLEKHYGSSDDGWDHIAFSNVVKCTSTTGKDKTSSNCAIQCIKNNGVIIKEIELLQPRKIIFYTWSMHRCLFKELPFAKDGSITEHTNYDFRLKCGKKELGWWDRTFEATWGEKVDFLIMGHPERMKKSEYVEMVSNWLAKP